MKNNEKVTKYSGKGPGGNAVYGLGMIGAVIYFWQQASTFWMVVLGLLKALVWPAYLVHALLKLLNI